MTFRLPAPEWEDEENRFQFELSDGTKSWLPLLKYVKPSLVLKLDGGERVDVINELLNSYQPGLFEAIETGSQLEALFTEWTKASGVELGESSPSQD